MKKNWYNSVGPSVLLGPVLILVCVAVLYGQFLWNPLIFDDLAFFMFDAQGGQPIDSFLYFPLGLRSLPYATLTWTKAWLGLDLIYFRLGNLLLHAATVLALYAFLKYLFSVVYTGKNAESLGANQAALLAALLFALHPIATYAVGYLVQRTIVMATLFSLLSLWTYAKGSAENKPWWLWCSVPLYYLAVYSKEHAIMLPAVLLSLTVLLHADWRVRLKNRWAQFAVMGGIAVLVVLTRKELFGSVYEPDAKDMLGKDYGALAYPLSVVTQCALFFKYLLLWIWPNTAWTSIDMREPFVRSLTTPYSGAVLAYLAWGATAIWLLAKRGNKGLAGFAMLFPWVLFISELYSVRIQEPFVLYRSYLWATAGFGVLPVLLVRFNRRVLFLVLAAVGLTLSMLSMERMATFSNPVLVWEDAKKLVEGKPSALGAERIYYNLGRNQYMSGMLDLSVQNLHKAIGIEPNYAQAHGVLGAVYIKQGQWAKAIAEYTSARAINQTRGEVQSSIYLVGRARAYEGIGAPQDAINDYVEACRIDERVCETLRKSATQKK